MLIEVLQADKMERRIENEQWNAEAVEPYAYGPEPGPELMKEHLVIQAALRQFIRHPESSADFVDIAKLVLLDLIASGRTAKDFYNHSYPAMVVATAFEMYIPDEGPGYHTSLAIAEAFRGRMRQVRPLVSLS